jgi:hypothetical protein
VTLVAVCGVKGRPGVTTTALGLAVVLSVSVRPVLVECDPVGGDLAARFGLASGRGLASLATEARAGRTSGGVLLERHSWWVTVAGRQVPVLCAPPGGAQAAVALRALVDMSLPVLNPPDRLVVADCGRLEVGSAAWTVVGAAQAVLVLVRGTVEAIAHLLEQLPELCQVAERRVGLVLAPGGPYPAEEVAEAVRRCGWPVPVLGALPADPRAAAVLDGAPVGARRWPRSTLAGALGRLAGPLFGLPRPSLPAVTAASAPRGPLAGEGAR